MDINYLNLPIYGCLTLSDVFYIENAGTNSDNAQKMAHLRCAIPWKIEPPFLSYICTRSRRLNALRQQYNRFHWFFGTQPQGCHLSKVESCV